MVLVGSSSCVGVVVAVDCGGVAMMAVMRGSDNNGGSMEVEVMETGSNEHNGLRRL